MSRQHVILHCLFSMFTTTTTTTTTTTMMMMIWILIFFGRINRPIAGHANFNPSALNPDPDFRRVQVGVALHEISHALGMSSLIFFFVLLLFFFSHLFQR
jgi:hypothetical protein